MIPRTTIADWRKVANWPLDGQVEQDLVISRALVEIFNNDYLKNKIAFRGGTALHKLVFPKPLRYSEDIDLNRLEKGPTGAVIDAIKVALNEMLGNPKKVKSTENSIKIIYDYETIDGEIGRLKIEINIRETLPLKPLSKVPFEVDSAYFQGSADIMSFDTEEMIGTKIRALYQRAKGRDLFDLYELSKLALNWNNIVENFKKLNIGASRVDFEKNLDEKMLNNSFLEDMAPLLPADIIYEPEVAHSWFKKEILPRM